MQKKIIIQVFLFLLIIIISVIFFKFYFKPTNLTKEYDSKINNSDSNQNNLMSNIKYFAADKIGNEYIVQSKLAEFDPNQPNLILMEEVTGVIQFTNSSPILISSDKAIYNKLNHDTKFFENVLAAYDDHKISSQNLELFFDKNLASISKKIIYKNLNTELRADRIEIDLVTKNSKILMDKKTKKVKVLTLN